MTLTKGVIIGIIGIALSIGALTFLIEEGNDLIEEQKTQQPDQVEPEIILEKGGEARIIHQETTDGQTTTVFEYTVEPELETQPQRKGTDEFYSYQTMKNDVDENFACENYHDLAKKYAGQPLAGFKIKDRYDGTMEGYIYYKAFKECTNPDFDENYDKVFKELEEVYADDLSGGKS